MSASFELPDVLDQVARVAGLDVAAALATAFGGQNIYVPKPERMTARHRIAKGLAAEGRTLKDARAVAEAVGGARMDIPFGPFGGPQGRRRAAAKMLREGATKARTAAVVGVSERTVYRVAEVANQPDLFSTQED